jgi:hypothetical protein
MSMVFGPIALNRIVYEGFYGTIKKCATFYAIKTLGGVERERRSRPSETEPRGALALKRPQTLLCTVGAYYIF